MLIIKNVKSNNSTDNLLARYMVYKIVNVIHLEDEIR